jgi:hypothetical protein
MNEYQKILGSIIFLLVISNFIDQYKPSPVITGLRLMRNSDKQHEISKIDDVLSDVKTKLKLEMSNEVDSFVEDELKRASENGQLSPQMINIISDKLKTKYFDPSDTLHGSLVSSDSVQNAPILYSDIPSHFNLDDSGYQYKSLSLTETPVSEPTPRKSYNIDGQQFLNPCDPTEKFGFVDANGSYDNYAPVFSNLDLLGNH